MFQVTQSRSKVAPGSDLDAVQLDQEVLAVSSVNFQFMVTKIKPQSDKVLFPFPE